MFLSLKSIQYEELKLNPAHVVFDEFQWMANYRNEIVSELKPVWDLRISGIDGITLLLCGSIASFMIDKVLKSNAFFGRTDLVIHLKNFLRPDTSGWMGRSFEYLCIEHAAKISEMLGFSGIEFSFGPYFNAPGKDSAGVQIDLQNHQTRRILLNIHY